MGILYCVCAIACEENCKTCSKYLRLHPDCTINYPTWPISENVLIENSKDRSNE
jgi:hypothetical protein